MRSLIAAISLLIMQLLSAQTLYFPPNNGTWETVDPASLGWCVDSIPPLIEFLEANNSKAFIVLKDGKIAIEHYVGTFTQDSIWYWASAGKSLTSFLVGKAQADGLLDINDPSSDHLGTGWTSCTPSQEAAITVRDQLTMTTGLDDGVPDADCTLPSCLQYLTDPGTRWTYHNAPYTKLDGVITSATGQTLNAYVSSALTGTTGIAGLYLPSGYNNVFFSKPRSMARFGLLALNRGVWNGNDILGDDAYFQEMITPSQALNNSYGYLWWLNGQTSFMVPGSQFVFSGQLAPNAPPDMFSALGKNGQQINVVPSLGTVVVRMGNAPSGEGAAVAVLFNNELWGYLRNIFCTTTAVAETTWDVRAPYPVPAGYQLHLPSSDPRHPIADVVGVDGKSTAVTIKAGTIALHGFEPGLYIVRYTGSNGTMQAHRFTIDR